jgi:RHS repeat-associated protein
VVTLTGPAPAGGAAITLGGMRTNIAEFGSSLTIPPGATSASFAFNARPFLGPSHTTDITATYLGITQAFRVTVRPVTVTRNELRDQPIQCASLAIAPCLTAAGLRPVAMAVGDPSKYYLYTPELQLLAETERSTSSTKPIAYSYLCFGGDPVAQISSANTVLWYATDHLGTPLLLTDATGSTVWRAELTPYGETFTYRTGAALHQPLRLPGQMPTEGREYYYNIFRWYRSSWGRFTQADPILTALDQLSSRGGTSRISSRVHEYGYAGLNPLSRRDRKGLQFSIPSSSYDDPDEVWVCWLKLRSAEGWASWNDVWEGPRCNYNTTCRPVTSLIWLGGPIDMRVVRVEDSTPAPNNPKWRPAMSPDKKCRPCLRRCFYSVAGNPYLYAPPFDEWTCWE